MIALDHTPPSTMPRVARLFRLFRLFRAIRARVAAFHWFVVSVEPSDPFATMSSRDRWDLPVFHPAQPED